MCGRNPMRVVGGLLALLYLAVGLVFFVIGFILQTAPASSMMKYILPTTNQLNGLLAPASAQFNPFEFIGALPQLTGNIAAAFIAMGAVQSIIGVIGMAALFSGHRRPILSAFFIMLLLMIVLQIALIVLHYALRGPIIVQAKRTMQATITEKYTGHNTTNMETVLLNVFHVSLSCCGINGGRDFDGAPNWARSFNYSGKYYSGMSRPLTCCKAGSYVSCLQSNHTDLTSTNQDNGCWNEIENIVDTNIVYAALGTGALILLEVLLLAFSASVCYAGRMKATPLELSQLS